MSTEKLASDTAKRIFYARKAKGLTQKDFANDIGISQSSLSEIENGKFPPSLPIILAIAYRYSISEHWLLTGKGEMLSTDDLIAREDQDIFEKCCGGKRYLHFLIKCCSKKDMRLARIAAIAPYPPAE